MPSSTRTSAEAAACRRCAVWCDKVVYPSGCVESGCPNLYSYEEHGRTFVGCLERVFRVEIDLGAIMRAEARRPGFGALRAMREPLKICRVDVEPAFEHRACGACLNPDFLLSGTRHPLTVSAARRHPAG
jgi:hypothetical protein